MALAALFLGDVALAEVKLPAIFGDHMVLQRDKIVPVWGTAAPGESVTVRLGKAVAETRAAADGKWQVKLPALRPSAEALELRVDGENHLTFTDVLIGDVWLCSGQSNMAWPLKTTAGGAAAAGKAWQPLIRLFKVEARSASSPQTSCLGKWVVCTPETAAGFSATAYNFAFFLQDRIHQPMGLIGSCLGATAAVAWTPLTTLQSLESYKKTVLSIEADCQRSEPIEAVYERVYQEWQAKAAQVPQGGKAPPKPEIDFRFPTGLYNAMIAPLQPYAITGVIWYQGEQDANFPVTATAYSTLFPALIRGWRSAWGQGDFPFLFVQLAGYGKSGVDPTFTPWACVREGQAKALSVPHTAMTVTVDVGSIGIHPPNKLDVGHRLALTALKVAYGQEVVHSGPSYAAMHVEGGKIRVRFQNTGSGLVLMNPPGQREQPAPTRLAGFAIAGEDRHFQWAEAVIDGDSVVAWNERIEHPVAVRYAWNNQPQVNLYNRESLPAVPFRTDQWPWTPPMHSPSQ